mmetsp:Transcript_29327/g.5297  ORF Transcript_29327/g.5297 Transcript_29327/m.5297 type:complete len:82 (-) Transcript_29327:327-572(-)|eukprot:CAMPEP_0168314890 /NCGR_PEP_ID=MMETSP0210-20121227/9666_1 /TAXON_ID=40633 /ORGANISM="Condylostoma magnum, Strain COL2" /LENGTH=81 /DNA_ID=CAMNT_0008285445 /DNA_START=138 /DNA_END=383 /DNA_ORIENTATION=+
MTLILKDHAGDRVQDMLIDNQTLGFYGAQDSYTIHIVDTNPDAIDLEDDSVPKYEISEEEYAKRDDTFRKFREEQLKRNPR